MEIREDRTNWLFSAECVVVAMLTISSSPLAILLPSGNLLRYLTLLIGGVLLVPTATLYITKGRNCAIYFLLFMYFDFLSWVRTDFPLDFQQTAFRYICFLSFFAGAGVSLREQHRGDHSLTRQYNFGGISFWVVLGSGTLLIPLMLLWILQGQGATEIAGSRFVLDEMNAVGIGYVFGNIFAGSIALAVLGRDWQISVWSAIACLSFLIVLQTASRGPILAAIITAVILFSIYRKSRSNYPIITGIAAVTGIFSVVTIVSMTLLPNQVGFVINRFSRLFDDTPDADRSTSGRLSIWEEYLENWPDWILLGSPETELKVGHYAHNLLIDAGVSFGLVGIGFLIVHLWLTICLVRSSMFGSHGVTYRALLLMGVFSILVAFVSCKLFMLRTMWLVMGMAAATSVQHAPQRGGHN